MFVTERVTCELQQLYNNDLCYLENVMLQRLLRSIFFDNRALMKEGKTGLITSVSCYTATVLIIH